MNKELLLNTIREVHPGWAEWDELIVFIESLELEKEYEEHFGNFLVSGSRLCFGPFIRLGWPEWMPNYVGAIYGMKADIPLMSGGYAWSFDGTATVSGEVFLEGGAEQQLGFPSVDVPEGVYKFQTNSSGALFHIDQSLNILAPNSDKKCLEKIDSLEDFTKNNIRQVLLGQEWFKLYQDLPGIFLD